MKRREFITLLGGAAAAWRLAARAQQGERMRRVGVLMFGAADDREATAIIAAFVQGLKTIGLVLGRRDKTNVRPVGNSEITANLTRGRRPDFAGCSAGHRSA